jgi:putative zinc finger/helix-turn-helix YgiT family protein
MNAFCPNCEAITQQVPQEQEEIIPVRGEDIPVLVKTHVCQACGMDYSNPQEEGDPLDAAYRIYRERRHMLQPEEIRAFRKMLGLTQQEWSTVLGIGIATLNRYENGALQSEGHDQMLQLMMQPGNLVRTLAEKPALLPEAKRAQVLENLAGPESSGSLLAEAEDHYGRYEPDIFSGYVRLDLEKFFQATQFLCHGKGVVKTKLLKLLFYADFLHFREHRVSITGMRYAHADHGPVPHRFETWLAALTDWEGRLEPQEQLIGDYVGTVYTSPTVDIGVFSASELKTLAVVKDHFEAYTATQIREESHAEAGYLETDNGELISYRYAEQLEL